MSKTRLTMSTILEAYRQIAPYVRPTPLLYSHKLSQLTQADVWLKLECWQETGSFKIRGALHKIGRLSANEKARGIVAASAGNHALGVAYAVQKLGHIPAHIFVPETAPQAKLDKLAQFQVTIHQTGKNYNEAHEAAIAFAQKSGAVEISAYDDPDIIAGQASVGIEIMHKLPLVDVVLVPVGGGGLIAGVASVIHDLRPSAQVIGVQPEACPAAWLSLKNGRAYDPYDHKPTIADGLAGGFGQIPFTLAADFITSIQLADEQTIRRAVYTLLNWHQLVVEPSGAIAIAPLLTNQLDIQGKRVVCILSGGNLDTRLLRMILNEFSE
ncbi:MAG: pyridoxal-phosphate dependent enzyme [Chloroflexi bacterium]|nr:MAG: pyridoxal-phosphate dependent enzyme [Chloroflexota bacterium]